ncbi:MAG: hypothetical protein P8Y54_11785 [Xanthomonadales bacterium]
MEGNLQHIVLRLGVGLLGVVMAVAVIRGLLTGTTSGYYRSHRYAWKENPTSFLLWILLRAALAAGSLYVVFGLY